MCVFKNQDNDALSGVLTSVSPSVSVGGRVLVVAHISRVLLPDVWARDGLTKTRSEAQHLYLRSAGAFGLMVGWWVGSPQCEERGPGHWVGGVGL